MEPTVRLRDYLAKSENIQHPGSRGGHPWWDGHSWRYDDITPGRDNINHLGLLYHGSHRRLVRGTVIRPSAQTGVPPIWPGASDPDFAYASRHMADAGDFAEAASHNHWAQTGQQLPPRAYRVEPVGAHEPDTDGDTRRSVRSKEGFRVVDWVESKDWKRDQRRRDKFERSTK